MTEPQEEVRCVFIEARLASWTSRGVCARHSGSRTWLTSDHSHCDHEHGHCERGPTFTRTSTASTSGHCEHAHGHAHGHDHGEHAHESYGHGEHEGHAHAHDEHAHGELSRNAAKPATKRASDVGALCWIAEIELRWSGGSDRLGGQARSAHKLVDGMMSAGSRGRKLQDVALRYRR